MENTLVEVKENPGKGAELASVVGTYLKNFLSEHTRLAYESDFRDFAKFLAGISGRFPIRKKSESRTSSVTGSI